MIPTLSGGIIQVYERPFQAWVHQRELSPGIQPQDKMQLFAVSFEPLQCPGTFPVIVLAFWLRESRTVIVQYSLEEQVAWRGKWSQECGFSFSAAAIRRIEKRLPALVAQALSAAGLDIAGATVVCQRRNSGLGMNDCPEFGGPLAPDWAVRRALGLDTRLGRPELKT